MCRREEEPNNVCSPKANNDNPEMTGQFSGLKSCSHQHIEEQM